MLEDYKKTLAKSGQLFLQIKAVPNKGENKIKEIMADGTIKIYLKAPAVKGKANEELISFLAAVFNLPLANIIIKSGTTDKFKKIQVRR